MNPRRRLHLVRHGAAEGVEGRVIGRTDPPLSAGGRRAIRRLAASWRGPAPAALVTSDLRRARESAELLAAAWSLEPEVDPRWREMDFGEWEGRTWDGVHAADAGRLERWGRSWWREAPPGGESFAAVIARVEAWYRSWRAAAVPGETVVVAHGGSIRALLAAALGLGGEALWHTPVSTARVSTLEATGEGLRRVAGDLPAFPEDGAA